MVRGGDEERFHSPQQVAELLGLHVRTVRRYVREGRLEAVRVGNRYRIPHRSLEALTGGPVGRSTPTTVMTHIDVSSVVDLEPISRTDADRVTTLVLGAVQHRPREDGALRVDVGYEPDRDRLRIIVAGPVAATSAVLALVTTYVEA